MSRTAHAAAALLLGCDRSDRPATERSLDVAIGETFDGGMVDAQAARAHADAAGVRVDAENVLYVRRAVLDEYEQLKMALRSESLDFARREQGYGKDPVSIDAAVALPERARALTSRCEEQVEALLAMANNLEKAARAYGHTDGDIAALTPKLNSTTAHAWLAETNASIGAALHPRGRA